MAGWQVNRCNAQNRSNNLGQGYQTDAGYFSFKGVQGPLESFDSGTRHAHADRFGHPCRNEPVSDYPPRSQ
jgi:hypothetical protein